MPTAMAFRAWIPEATNPWRSNLATNGTDDCVSGWRCNIENVVAVWSFCCLSSNDRHALHILIALHPSSTCTIPYPPHIIRIHFLLLFSSRLKESTTQAQYIATLFSYFAFLSYLVRLILFSSQCLCLRASVKATGKRLYTVFSLRYRTVPYYLMLRWLSSRYPSMVVLLDRYCRF